MIDFLMITFFALTLLGAILAVNGFDLESLAFFQSCVNFTLVSYLYTQFRHKEKGE